LPSSSLFATIVAANHKLSLPLSATVSKRTVRGRSKSRSRRGEEAKTERDPSLVFSLKLFFSCEEVYPESGFCLGGEKLGLWGFAGKWR